jgi:cystathionine gamma-synthase
MRIETRAVHAGGGVDPATGAVAAPIHLSTTFERDPDGSFPRGHVYSRNSNANRNALEACLAMLEGGVGAAAFGSGTAASLAVFLSLGPGDHVIAPHDVYHGTARLLRDHLRAWGLGVTFVDMTDPGAVGAAVRPETRLVWVETPSNPLLKITDVAAVAAIAHDAGARCVVDNTFATPVLQRPFERGADLVVHATTKYLGGHSDVMGGAVVARVADAFWERVRAVQVNGGAVPSPFDCWLVLRSIRTLPARMRAHAAHARAVAEFLRAHPRVERVHYPGLPGHPGHAIAARQMSGFGGMVSVQVRGDRAAAMDVAAKVRLFTRATSFGTVESLIEHRASIEGPESRTPDNLLRLSIGLEHPDDLIEDLAQALG